MTPCPPLIAYCLGYRACWYLVMVLPVLASDAAWRAWQMGWSDAAVDAGPRPAPRHEPEIAEALRHHHRRSA